jgi:hypothetical protein
MTDVPSKNYSNSRKAAAIALFDAIARGVEEIATNDRHDVSQQTSRLKDLAIAFRAVDGGPQPTSIDS